MPPEQNSNPPLPYPPSFNEVKPSKGRKKLAQWLLIGPTALIIASIALSGILNLASNAVTPAPTGDTNTVTTDPDAPRSLFGEDEQSDSPEMLFGETTPLETAGNVILFLAGAIGVLAWLPGIIAGTILLATRK